MRWRNLCFVLWPIFWLGHLFFWNWAAGAARIFLKLILCQLLHLLLFSAHSEGCLFTLLIVSFLVQKLLSLIRSICLFCFHFHYSGRWIIEDLAVIYVRECFAYVFLRIFIVFDFTFRSLIHLEFIFVYGVKKCSSFILLQVVDQFSKHHLLKILSFLHCIFLPPLSKIRYL